MTVRAELLRRGGEATVDGYPHRPCPRSPRGAPRRRSCRSPSSRSSIRCGTSRSTSSARSTPGVAPATACCGRGEIADYELIVVDDASTDATGEIADRIAADDPRVRVVHHERNRKLGGAMKTGFAAATGDLILYTDADLPFDMAELPRAVRLLRDYDADIVSAYRFDRTGEGYLRSVYTFVYNLLIRTLFDVKARDINFAFKLCRARIFDHVELTSEGSFIDAELVIRSTRLGYEMLQFGVDYFPRTRGVSTLSSPGVIATIVREMWSLRADLDGIEPVVDRTYAPTLTGARTNRHVNVTPRRTTSGSIHPNQRRRPSSARHRHESARTPARRRWLPGVAAAGLLGIVVVGGVALGGGDGGGRRFAGRRRRPWRPVRPSVAAIADRRDLDAGRQDATRPHAERWVTPATTSRRSSSA